MNKLTRYPKEVRERAIDIRRVWEDNFRVYGARKAWRQLNRERIPIDQVVDY